MSSSSRFPVQWILALSLIFMVLAAACTFDTSGPVAPDSNNFSPCEDDRDCASLSCQNDRGFCLPAACDDGRLNGDETALDCGGACDPCPDGAPCLVPGDCEGQLCQGGFCQPDHCVDGLPGEDETDLDCGGSCAPCADGADCLIDADCRSRLCDPDTCVPAGCADDVLNGDELDVDCGGTCGPCPDGSRCLGDEDCEGGLCVQDFCQPETCVNEVLDGDETDLDCGGSCVGCDLDQACLDTPDCARGLVCHLETCRLGVTVDFDANGGVTPEPLTLDVIVEEPYGTLPVTTRPGHTFEGWWTAPDGAGERITADTVVTATVDHTLYARWSAQTSTVTFDAQGGGALTPGSKLVVYGEPYGTLATTTRTGYTFDGWWTGANGTGSPVFATTVVTITGDHTLFAKWLPNTYTVTFDANGGAAPDPASRTVVFGNPYGTLATTTRTGHTFDGWWTGAGGTGTQVTPDTLVANAADHTLYAKWIANTYTVTFDAEGGSAPNPASKVVTFGLTYGALATTSRAGYTFGGWWTGDGGTGTQIQTTTVVATAADHTLYARWVPNTYTVTFDAEGGSAPNPASKVVTFGLTYGTLATTARAGYTFGGWWTGDGGTGTQIQTTTVVTATSNHTLYARWVPNTYTVTFDAEGGSAPNPASKVVTFGLTYGTLATSALAGKTFAGWWTGDNGTGTQILSTTVVSTAANHTLYAKWE